RILYLNRCSLIPRLFKIRKQNYSMPMAPRIIGMMGKDLALCRFWSPRIWSTGLMLVLLLNPNLIGKRLVVFGRQTLTLSMESITSIIPSLLGEIRIQVLDWRFRTPLKDLLWIRGNCLIPNLPMCQIPLIPFLWKIRARNIFSGVVSPIALNKGHLLWN